MDTTLEKQGYKYTEEFGYIPEDWEVSKVLDKSDVKTGGTPSTSISEYWNGNVKWMSSGELNNKRIYDVEGRITELGLNNSSATLIPANCILIGLAGQGKTRGTAAINYVELSTNQSIAAILPSKHFNSEYLYQSIDKRYEELRELSSGGGGRGGLNKALLMNLPILLPPIPEQEKIAEVLGDVDSLVDKTQQLINKKKDLKTATMQKLLTPKEDWVEKKLSDISTFINGLSYESNICENGRYNLITLDSIDIQGKLKKSHKKVDNIDKFLPKGSLVMILSDVAHGYFLGLTDVIPEDNKYVLNQRVGGLISVREIIPRLLSLIINVNQDYFRICGQGSSQKNLSKDSIENFLFRFPEEYSEQERITTTLSDMDSEIEALEKELNKYKDLKTGMMQQLLTGKVRLI